MKPRVTLIKGTHITATDKRNILDCIEYLRKQDDKEMWVGRPRSPKQYQITTHPDTAGYFCVLIKEAYATDFGERRERVGAYVVEIQGIEPLPKVQP